jgi:hypothetical protein
MKRLFCLLLLSFGLAAVAQDIPIEGQKRIFFPHPMDRAWQTSVGFIVTTMNRAITEEAHFRVPAGDVHLLRRLGKHLYLDSRANIQVLQNMVLLGPRWATPLSDRISMALGNDLGYWFGRINIAGIRTRGSGFQNIPNAAVGYRFNKGILLTMRGEALMNFGIRTYAGETEVESNYRLFGGSAFSAILEQPFAGNKSMLLGFRAILTQYQWQTWTLFANYDRKLFFPQIMVGLIL